MYLQYLGIATTVQNNERKVKRRKWLHGIRVDTKEISTRTLYTVLRKKHEGRVVEGRKGEKSNEITDEAKLIK